MFMAKPRFAQDDFASALGGRLRSLRIASGHSRRALAAIAAVSERYLVQLEGGHANVSIGILSRVASALGADVVSLLRPPDDDAWSGLVRGMSPRETAAALPVLREFLEERRRAKRGIALLGLRGAGKSTIGGKFASRHGFAFVSVTREIEARAGMSLNDLFNLGGPDAYRSLENEAVAEIASRDANLVLEAAGGIVSNREALDCIFASFTTIWVKASPKEHLERVIGQGDMRPINGAPKAIEHLKSLLAQREAEYSRADLILDTSGRGPEACVDKLDEMLGEFRRLRA